MDKLQLSYFLDCGHVVEKEVKGKSEVRKSFTKLFYKDSNEYVNYVKGKACSIFLKHHQAHSGTSHLSQHISVCSKFKSSNSNDSPETSRTSTGKQGKVTNFFSKKFIPQTAKTKLTAACVEFVCRDMQPLKTVEGKGLVKLVQSAIKIGATYGNLEAKTLLPSRNTVQRKIILKAKAVERDTVEAIKFAIQKDSI